MLSVVNMVPQLYMLHRTLYTIYLLTQKTNFQGINIV